MKRCYVCEDCGHAVRELNAKLGVEHNRTVEAERKNKRLLAKLEWLTAEVERLTTELNAMSNGEYTKQDFELERLRIELSVSPVREAEDKILDAEKLEPSPRRVKECFDPIPTTNDSGEKSPCDDCHESSDECATCPCAPRRLSKPAEKPVAPVQVRRNSCSNCRRFGNCTRKHWIGSLCPDWASIPTTNDSDKKDEK